MSEKVHCTRCRIELSPTGISIYGAPRPQPTKDGMCAFCQDIHDAQVYVAALPKKRRGRPRKKVDISA